jgi:hypothetical protein
MDGEGDQHTVQHLGKRQEGHECASADAIIHCLKGHAPSLNEHIAPEGYLRIEPVRIAVKIENEERESLERLILLASTYVAKHKELATTRSLGQQARSPP